MGTLRSQKFARKIPPNLRTWFARLKQDSPTSLLKRLLHFSNLFKMSVDYPGSSNSIDPSPYSPTVSDVFNPYQMQSKLMAFNENEFIDNIILINTAAEKIIRKFGLRKRGRPSYLEYTEDLEGRCKEAKQVMARFIKHYLQNSRTFPADLAKRDYWDAVRVIEDKWFAISDLVEEGLTSLLEDAGIDG